jgi:hypothetical protein
VESGNNFALAILPAWTSEAVSIAGGSGASEVNGGP